MTCHWHMTIGSLLAYKARAEVTINSSRHPHKTQIYRR